MYKFDLSRLQPGDIILRRFDDDTSRAIIQASGSNYSHAMLHVGGGSAIEATTDIVVASYEKRNDDNNAELFGNIYRMDNKRTATAQEAIVGLS